LVGEFVLSEPGDSGGFWGVYCADEGGAGFDGVDGCAGGGRGGDQGYGEQSDGGEGGGY